MAEGSNEQFQVLVSAAFSHQKGISKPSLRLKAD